MILTLFEELQLLYLLEHHPTVIVVGATGCGKSTQIPQYLNECGWTSNQFRVCCTQPRRVAATSVAERVAVEMGCIIGEEVSYSIRFEDNTSPKTKIKFLTDGMLIREMMVDPLLSQYSVVMVDEAHERSINTDILLGLLKKVQFRRKDLRLIISSATVDALEFQRFFNDHRETLDATITKNWIDPSSENCAEILSVEGRLWPVECLYTPKPVTDYITASLQAIFDIHDRHKLSTGSQEEQKISGDDILVFLTGQEEIDDLVRRITEQALRSEQQRPKDFEPIVALPMYSGLSQEAQSRVFKTSYGARRVIVSTNICETSVTIDGIGFVIDCGFMKIRAFSAGRSNQEILAVVPVSKSSANQRAGRAGRTGPGKCLRLYTENTFSNLSSKTVPEVQRTNLSPMILQLKALGIDNLMRFDFLSPPPSELVANALETLCALGALDAATAKLTDPIGTCMAEIPLEPTLARVLIASARHKCLDSLLSISAMLSVPSVFVHPKGLEKKADTLRRKFSVREGDHLTLLNVYNAFVEKNYDPKWCHAHYFNFRSLARAVDVRKQLKRAMRRIALTLERGSAGDATNLLNDDSASNDDVAIRKCLLHGFFMNVARLQPNGTYATVQGGEGEELLLHPSSILCAYPPDWVMFHEVVHTSKQYMHDVSKVEPSWLLEVAPQYYKTAS